MKTMDPYHELAEINRKGVDTFNSKSFRKSARYFAMALSKSRNLVRGSSSSSSSSSIGQEEPAEARPARRNVGGVMTTATASSSSRQCIKSSQAARRTRPRSSASNSSAAQAYPPLLLRGEPNMGFLSVVPRRDEAEEPLQLQKFPIEIDLRGALQSSPKAVGDEEESCTLHEKILASAVVVFNMALCFHRCYCAYSNTSLSSSRGQQQSSSLPNKNCAVAQQQFVKAQTLYRKSLDLLKTIQCDIILMASPSRRHHQEDQEDYKDDMSYFHSIAAKHVQVAKAAYNNLKILEATKALHDLGPTAASPAA